MSHATGGRGARTRTDSVGAFATKNPGQVFDGVGVHQDCPRVNAPKVSKEREIHSHEAMRWRFLHDSPFKLRGVDNTQKKKKSFLFGNKGDLSDEVQRGLESRIPKFPESFGAMLSKPARSQSWDDLFIHVDLFVFPPLAVHNKDGGVEFQREPHCTEMAVYSPCTGARFKCLCNDNDLQSLSECQSLSDAHWKLYPKWGLSEPS